MKKYFVKAISIISLFSLIAFGCNNRKTGSQKPESEKREINILSYGGAFGDAQREAYYKPFAEKINVKVTENTYDGEYGKLKAMSQTGNVVWDVVDVEASTLMRGIKEDLFMPIDYNIVSKSGLIPQGVNDFGVASDFYSVSLGFNTKQFPASGNQPKNWKDFWDIKKFPGIRCMKNDPKFSLEIALLADGVQIENIYAGKGLDVDRAFRKLDEIKSYVKVWWTTGQQPIQLLADGEVDMVAAFGARIWIAKNKDKRPVDLTWNQSITEPEYWCVLKGAKNAKLSMEFISFATLPEHQAAFSKIFPLGPANLDAFKFFDENAAKELNTFPENIKAQLMLNSKWWADNEGPILERWNTWINKR